MLKFTLVIFSINEVYFIAMILIETWREFSSRSSAKTEMTLIQCRTVFFFKRQFYSDINELDSQIKTAYLYSGKQNERTSGFIGRHPLTRFFYGIR